MADTALEKERNAPSQWHINSLNTVRLVAAISVMYGHVRLHLSVPTPDAVTAILDFFFGVPIFFCMSGFLVWNSIGRSRCFGDYAKKRFWRIYPELWCGVALELIVLLLLAKQSVEIVPLLAFTVTQSTFLQFWTPDSLRFYGCGTPNGSLWTICVMIQFYILAYFAYRLLHKRKLRWWIAVQAVFILIAVASPYLSGVLPVILYKLYNQTILPYFWLFLTGAFVAEKRDVIVPFLKKYWYAFIAISIFVIVSRFDVNGGPYGYGILRCIALFLGLLGFAYRFPGMNVKHDISYGIYIYHMTVVNAMIELGYTGQIRWLIIAMAISCLLAFVSERIFSRLVASQKSKLVNRKG